MPAQTQTRRILIKVDTSESKALKDIADKMGMLNKNTKSLAGNMGFLTNAFRGWIGFLGVREITRLSDSMQNLTSQLRVVGKAGEDTGQTLAKIDAIADRTNQSITGVGEVYTRMAGALRNAKGSTEEVLALTESLIDTFRVAGATTTETTNTIIQLSQAFSSGELRGQELRSVMEQNVVLAGLLRERFGQDIYKKAADGAIRVTDVLKVLADNQERISAQAKLLVPTFDQTLTKAMNKLSLAINALNSEFGLAAKFASLMGFAMDNLAGAMILAGTAATVWAISYLPALIAGFTKLRTVVLAFALSNPLLAIFAAVSVAVVLVINNWDKLNRMMILLKANVLELAATVKENLLPALQKLAVFAGFKPESVNLQKKSIAGLREEAAKLRKELEMAPAAGAAGPQDDQKNQIEALIKKLEAMAQGSGKVAKLKEILGEINQQYQSGAIGISLYNKKLIDFQLYKVNRQFSEGKMDIFEYHEQIRDLNIAQLNRELAAGVVNLEQFNTLVSGEKLKVLNEQFEAGRISIAEYNKELILLEDKFRPGSAFQVGAQDYINSAGTISQGIAKGIENAFGGLEKGFMDFVKTGKQDWKDFAQSVLDDLSLIIIRASIVRPLAQGLLGLDLFSGGGAGAGVGSTGGGFNSPIASAKGNAFDGGKLMAFAKGGIVNSPTMFSYGGGKSGLMGEAGSEAILPLSRGSNGNLGVQASVTPVTVNIINNSGSQVSQTESVGSDGSRQIDVIIEGKIKDAFASGKMDRTMGQQYGLKRRGS